MSNKENYSVVSVRTPILRLNNKRVFTVIRGAAVNNAQSFPAPSPNNNSITIICTPPSESIAIDRCIYKKATWTVAITGTNTSGSSTLLQPGFFGPRPFPLTEITNSEQMTINQATVTMTPVNQFLPASQWYSSCHEIRNGPLSSGFSTLDKSQNYSDLIGSALNPLLGYQASNGFDIGRGIGPQVQVLTNTATTATLAITSIEPIFMSPFASGAEQYSTSSLIAVNNMTYTAIFNSTRMMSMIQNQGVTGISITSVIPTLTNFTLEFSYLTPEPSQNIPRTLISSYYEVQQSITNTNQTVAPNAQITCNTTNFQLTGIPSRLMIYVGQNQQAIANDTMGLLSNSWMGLADGQNVLTIQWNNNTFFQSYTREQLYNISVSNGLTMSYEQWIYYVGSVVVLELGKDIGLAFDEAPGLEGNFQIQIQMQVVNTNQTNSIVNPQMQVFSIYAGIFQLINGSASSRINILTKEDVVNAEFLNNVKYVQSRNIYGGFFSGFTDLLSKGHDFLKNSKAISNISGLVPHPYAQALSGISGALGYGENVPRKRGGAKRIKGRGLDSSQHRPLASRIYGAGTYADDDDEDEYIQ